MTIDFLAISIDFVCLCRLDVCSSFSFFAKRFYHIERKKIDRNQNRVLLFCDLYGALFDLFRMQYQMGELRHIKSRFTYCIGYSVNCVFVLAGKERHKVGNIVKHALK